jgi:acyl transferase domain-containing protein
MAAELYETEPAFREQVDYCAGVLTSHLGHDIRDVLFRRVEEAKLELQQTSLTQPALFVVNTRWPVC